MPTRTRKSRGECLTRDSHETTREHKGVHVGVKTDPEVSVSWQRQGGQARRAPRRKSTKALGCEKTLGRSTRPIPTERASATVEATSREERRGQDRDCDRDSEGKLCPAGILGAKHPSFPPAVPPSSEEGSWLEVNRAWGPASRVYDLRIRPLGGVRMQRVMDSTSSGNLRWLQS